MSTKARAKSKRKTVRIIACPNPFDASARIIRTVPAGKTYKELISLVTPSQYADKFAVYVMRDDYVIPEEQFNEVAPAGSIVSIRVMPGTQAVENVVSAVSIAAGIILTAVCPPVGLALLAVGVGCAVASSTGAYISTSTSAAATTTKKSTATKTLPSITGASNSTNPNGPLPIILGKHYIAPYYACDPWTEIGGDDGCDQYMHLCFVVGYGPLKLTNFCLGTTLLASNSAGVTDGGVDCSTGCFPTNSVNLEIRSCSTTPLTYFPNRVKSNSNMDIELHYPIGLSPVENIRTTAKKTTSITVDITFNSGLVGFEDDGTPKSASVTVNAYYRKVGDSTWTKFDSSWGTITKTLKKTCRYTATQSVASGQYQVKVLRETQDQDTDSSTVDTVTWSALKSTFSEDPIDLTNFGQKVVRVGLKIKATSGSFNGSISEFNCIAQQLIPVYTGSGSGAASWTASALTRNPAAELVWLLRGPANPKAASDTNIDWPAFEALYTWCDTHVNGETEGRNCCDAVESSTETLRDLLKKVCNTCRSVVTMYGNQYSVVQDVAKTTIAGLITPRNSWGFQGQKSFDDIPKCLRLSFINEDALYQQDEAPVYQDGYGSTTSGGLSVPAAGETETMDTWGIVRYSQVHREGRYWLAKLILRQEAYVVSMDFEHLVFQVGDRVKFQHDVTLHGITAGRVKSVTLDSAGNATGMTVDEALPMVASASYGIRLRKTDGTLIVALLNPVTTSANVTEVTFATAIAAASIPEEGDLFAFGVASSETTDALIIGIEPKEDLSAKIYLCDYAPGVFTADTGTIPAHDSAVTLPYSIDPVGEVQKASIDAAASKNSTTALAATAAANASSAISALGITSGKAAPADVSGLTVVAHQDYIEIVIPPVTGSTVASQAVAYIVQRQINGGDWKDINATVDGLTQIATTDYAWPFNRVTDGYPEASAVNGTTQPLSAYKFRAKAVNGYGLASTGWSPSVTPDVSSYGTWIPTKPAPYARASGRLATIGWAEQTCYGFDAFEIQISKDAATWYQPATDLNPYNDEGNWRESTTAGLEHDLSVPQWNQSMPLDGQASNAPVDTAFYFRVRVRSVITGRYSDYGLVTCIAKATGASDTVLKSITAAKFADGAVLTALAVDGTVTAKGIAAISGLIGCIAGGSLDPYNFFALDSVSADHSPTGAALSEGQLRVGVATTYFKVDPTLTDYQMQMIAGSDYIKFGSAGIDMKVSVMKLDATLGSYLYSSLTIQQSKSVSAGSLTISSNGTNAIYNTATKHLFEVNGTGVFSVEGVVSSIIETHLSNGTWTDPDSGVACALKASGKVAIGGDLKVTGTITASALTLNGPITRPLLVGNNVASDSGAYGERLADFLDTTSIIKYIEFGYGAGNYNCGELYFNYSGDQSSANTIGLKFYGEGYAASILLGGNVVIQGGCDLNLRAATGSSDSGDIVYRDGAGDEIGRIWSNNGAGICFSSHSSPSADMTITSGGVLTANAVYGAVFN